MEKSSSASIGMKDSAKRVENRDHAEEIVAKATHIFKETYKDPAQAIPASVLAHAAGIAIFPDMRKAALLVGGSHGSGVILARQEGDEWSAPLFVTLSKGSFGPQVGFESSDLILVFQDHDLLDSVAHGKEFTFGADAGVTAGRMGKNAMADTSHDKVLVYTHASGLFAGASLSGNVLRVDRDATIAYYELSQGKEGARAYRENGEGLYDRIIGSTTRQDNGMMENKSTSMKLKLPESAVLLQQAIKEKISKDMDRM